MVEQEKRPSGRPVEKEMPPPIPDTPENVAGMIMNTYCCFPIVEELHRLSKQELWAEKLQESKMPIYYFDTHH